jgi:phage tail-like protein
MTIVIRLLDETGSPKVTWTLANAFAKQVTCTDLNSQSSEVAVETIVFAYEGLSMESA